MAAVFFGQNLARDYLVRASSFILVLAPPGTPGEVGLRVVQPSGCVEDVPYEYLP